MNTPLHWLEDISGLIIVNVPLPMRREWGRLPKASAKRFAIRKSPK